jgi:hypothetical protein
MERNQVLRIARTVFLVSALIAPACFWPPAQSVAQNKPAPVEYDYVALALASILSSAREASKLPEIPQRVKLLIYGAKTLPPSEHDEAVHLLDIALHDLKQWGSEEKAKWHQRNTAATLRNEVLALYASLDPEKAMALQKEFQSSAESTASNSAATTHQDGNWITEFLDQRTTADQAANVALAIINTYTEKALALVVQSLQGGVVSSVLCQLVQELIQDGNRAVLSKLEIAIGQVLAANVTADPFSPSYAAILVQSDQDMPPTVRNVFVSFLMRSLQAWSNLVTDPSRNAGIDTSYISATFTVYSASVRSAILQYSPEQLPMFDFAMNQVAPLVPEKTRSASQSFRPETFSDPTDLLTDILKDPNPERRDMRLIGLTSKLLRSDSGDPQKNLDLASDAVSSFSDPDLKAAFGELLTMTRVNALVNQQKFVEAQRLAGSISSDERRAWALLALSAVAAKADRVLGFELISNALNALDTASPSPHKVELALIATAMLVKDDRQRAFDTLSVASRYANSSASKVAPPAKPPVAFGLDASIGGWHTKIGVFPESLGEVAIDPSLSLLATTDWLRADQIVSDIHDPALRLQLKLQFAGAVLAQASKSRKKQTTPKASSIN